MHGGAARPYDRSRDRRARSRTPIALAAAFALCAPRAANADTTDLPPPFFYNYGETENARSAAMSGSLRALGSGTTGLFLNPANIAETRVYHIEGNVQLTPEVARHIYGGAVVDSITSRLAGGLEVDGGWIDQNNLDRSLINARLVLAFPVSDKFFIGVGGRYAKVWQQGLGPFGEDKVSGGNRDSDGNRNAFVNTGTLDAGITLKLTDEIYLAVSGQNVTVPNNAILPTTVGGGFGYGNKDLSIEADGVADFTSYDKTTGRFMLGGEYLAGDHVPIRLGYRYDQGAKKHNLSAGLGYIGNEFSVEAAVRRSLSNPGTTMIVLSVAYFLESTGLARPAPEF